MAKRKDTQDKSAAWGDMPAMPAVEPKPAEPVPAEAPKIELVAEAPKVELPVLEAPKLGDARPAPVDDGKAAPFSEAAWPKAAPIPPIDAQEPAASRTTPVRINKFALLAASVAVAAALGAVLGAVGANGIGRSNAQVAAPAPVSTAAADATRALQGTIAQMRTDLAALRTSVEAGTKSTNGQFAKIAERFDRIERAQGEPGAKIGKAIEAIERLEKRVDALAAKDTTGSVATAQPAVATSPAPQPPIEGWLVRDVYRGTALIQGRRFGMLEVEPGDTIPGIGRVEAIKKQEGRWVVVTSKGVIASPR